MATHTYTRARRVGSVRAWIKLPVCVSESLRGSALTLLDAVRCSHSLLLPRTEVVFDAMFTPCHGRCPQLPFPNFKSESCFLRLLLLLLPPHTLKFQRCYSFPPRAATIPPQSPSHTHTPYTTTTSPRVVVVAVGPLHRWTITFLLF